MMQLSYWEKSTFFNDIDVAVIGSGIVGLHAAIRLKEQHLKREVVVVEAGSIPSGASTRNAGFACFGSITELANDLQSMGLDALLTLIEKRWKGLQRLRQRIGDQALDFKNWGGYELFLEQQHFEEHANFIAFFNRELVPIIGKKNIFSLATKQAQTFGFKQVAQLVLNSAEGQIHTGKMMQALLRQAQDLNIPIYNGITVRQLHTEANGVTIETQNGWLIPAQKVIVATNGFSKKLLPDLDLQPARNQVLITHPINDLRIKGTFHYDSGYYYFRNVGNRLLFGGGRNLSPEAETTSEFGLTEVIQKDLKKKLREVILPDTPHSIDSWWSGILGVGAAKSPIIQKWNEHIAVAVRLGGMGVAIGSLVGEEVAELFSEW